MNKDQVIAELDALVKRGEELQDGIDQMESQLVKIGEAITALRQQL